MAEASVPDRPHHFGAGVRFRHSSNEGILLWRPPVGHVTTIFPLPSALAAIGLT
jgi:hypothetical protein